MPLRVNKVFVDEKRKECHVSETKARNKWHLKLILGALGNTLERWCFMKGGFLCERTGLGSKWDSKSTVGIANT